MLIEVKIGALVVDPNINTPIVVLKGIESDKILPIWVGPFEAGAIASEIEKRAPQRPMTHDLLKNLISEQGCTVKQVVISDLVENTFFATVEIEDKSGGKIFLDARPSDAIALALRADCQIFVNESVFEISNSPEPEYFEPETEIDDATEDWPELIG